MKNLRIDLIAMIGCLIVIATAFILLSYGPSMRAAPSFTIPGTQLRLVRAEARSCCLLSF